MQSFPCSTFGWRSVSSSARPEDSDIPTPAGSLPSGSVSNCCFPQTASGNLRPLHTALLRPGLNLGQAETQQRHRGPLLVWLFFTAFFREVRDRNGEPEATHFGYAPFLSKQTEQLQSGMTMRILLLGCLQPPSSFSFSLCKHQQSLW